MATNLWDGVAVSFHSVSKNSKAHNKKYAEIADIIITGKFQRVLDLGCGSGLLEQSLFRKGFSGEVVGVDGSAQMLDIARELNESYADKVTFRQGIISETLGINEKFDCVVMVNLLYLISGKACIISEIYEILEKNGKFVLVDPKPKGDNVAMIRENLSGRNFLENFVYIVGGAKTIYHAIHFAFVQKKLDRQYTNKEIEYMDIKDLKKLLSENSFIIERASEVQAGQNWMLVSRRD